MSVIVEVVDVEDEFHFLVELGTVDSQKTCQKLLRIKVVVMISVKHGENALGKQTWQLTIIEEADFVNSFGFIVTSTAQVLVDVFEVGETNFHFEVVCLRGLREG